MSEKLYKIKYEYSWEVEMVANSEQELNKIIDDNWEDMLITQSDLGNFDPEIKSIIEINKEK